MLKNRMTLPYKENFEVVQLVVLQTKFKAKSKRGIANSKGGTAKSKGGIANSKGGVANSKGGIAKSKGRSIQTCISYSGIYKLSTAQSIIKHFGGEDQKAQLLVYDGVPKLRACTILMICQNYNCHEGYIPQMINPMLDNVKVIAEATNSKTNQELIPFVVCGDLNGFDSDMSYNLNLGKNAEYTYRELVLLIKRY
uniref:Endonuclease/exonuclease/phosphatase domain-containing protein n=1 Tax=Glossina morsitans morsitans TaxID=37546 RepID=A0A1B0GC01_GLOMM